MNENHIKNVRSNDIILDDASKVYNIRNRKGKLLGKFEFRPTDTNIVNRYEEVLEFFNKFEQPEGTEAMKAAEREVIEKISYLIGADSKETFFQIAGPFSPLENGELFVEQVLKSVAQVIEKELSVRTKKVQGRMNKYVAKYRK